MKYKFLVVFLAGVMLLLQSCGVNSNVMFKAPKGEINYDSIPMFPNEAYRIGVDDKISFTLATNGGAKIVDMMSGIETTGSGSNNRTTTDFTVRSNGEVELPIIGDVAIAGLTIEQCEDTLETKFNMYQDPFVQVTVTNKRVIVFPGNGSDAKVIPLTNTNTTLMEAIAMAGGITDRGKANTVKLMRRENGERVVYGLDLSTVEGLQYADMIVQANDYIYIEPTAEIAKEISKDIVPVVSLISSALFIFSAINLFK